MGRLALIAAGGTGGHMFPAQALAEALLAAGWDVVLASDRRGLGYAGGFPAAVGRLALRSASPGRGGLVARLAWPMALARGVVGAIRAMARLRPAVVVGFGGYPAAPALIAAWALGVPRVIHEQNGVLGRVNRVFAGRVSAVCCGTWPVRGAPAGARLVATGNPVRARVAALVAPYAAPDPGVGPVRLVVFGGSQGAAIFARVVPAAIAALPAGLRARLDLTQQVRPGEDAAVAETYAEAGVAATLAPFFDDLPERMAAAHLVLARAGASTLAELTALGRPAILVPFAAAMDDHQTANAAALVAAGGAVLMPEPRFAAAALAETLGALLGDPDRLAGMARAAAGAGRTDATAALVSQVTLAAQPAA